MHVSATDARGDAATDARGDAAAVHYFTSHDHLAETAYKEFSAVLGRRVGVVAPAPLLVVGVVVRSVGW